MRGGAFAVLLLFVVACASSDGSIAVVDAWARPTPPNSDVAAFYVAVRNDGDAEVLVGADSDVCGSTALHDTVPEDNVIEMRHIEDVVIERGSTLTMEPGALHIMCLDLEEPLVEGQQVDATLLFSYAGRLDVSVSVEQR